MSSVLPRFILIWGPRGTYFNIFDRLRGNVLAATESKVMLRGAKGREDVHCPKYKIVESSNLGTMVESVF